MHKSLAIALTAVLVFTLTGGSGFAQSGSPPGKQEDSKSGQPAPPATPTTKPRSKLETLTDGMQKIDGMWTLYHKDQKLLAHLKPADFNREYIVLTSIARGISHGRVLGGMSWNFGDDVLWAFRKMGDKVHVLRRNVRFRAKPGTPEARAVQLAYSDSVLYALPILASERGGDLVDLTRIFMSDDQQIGRAIGPGFSFVSDRSTWAKVKAFPSNVELQVAAVYSGPGAIQTVSDSRGVQINVHYSISALPTNNYKPRQADDRIGYFLTVLKDFSDDSDDEHFVRYINRWDLQKADPKAKLSPPKDPIIFYMEKTVPVYLRPTVRAGIEEWNKAFEKLGFANAIEVRQQREEDDWDPEDVRYNTFRWITAEAGFAMGPSRVNPKTGQILDADIIFDASFLRYWRNNFETFTRDDVIALMGPFPAYDGELKNPFDLEPHHRHGHSCALFQGMQQQMGYSAAVLQGRGLTSKEGRLPEEFIHQALKEVVMHEVGHTLGLRHNFKASAWKSLEEIDEAARKGEPFVASVMDYTPSNITPAGKEQGRYYSTTIGPYDYWAIEYGYKPIAGDEAKELAKIASRTNEPGHDYATDEDTTSISSDPLVNRFDLGDDPVAFARRQMQVAGELIPDVVERSVQEGDGYHRARQAFGMLLSEYWRTASYASRFPGGVYVHRDHKGDEGQRPPFVIVEPDKQREAMKLLGETAFATPQFDGEMLRYLAPSRWRHWGMRQLTRQEYAIHDVTLMMQTRILAQLLSPFTLSRMQDSELIVPAEEDAYTLAEHFRTLVDGIFTEWDRPDGESRKAKYTNRNPYISSFRRNLQRLALLQLTDLVASERPGTPEDARTLTHMHLARLSRQIDRLLKDTELSLDDYSRAHLLDSQNRIRQVLEAPSVRVEMGGSRSFPGR